MVDVDAGLDDPTYVVDVAALARGDHREPAEPVPDGQVRVRGQQRLEHRDAPGDAGDQPGRVVLVVEGVRVGSERDEDPRDVGPVVRRRPAAGEYAGVLADRLQVGARAQGQRGGVRVAAVAAASSAGWPPPCRPVRPRPDAGPSPGWRPDAHTPCCERGRAGARRPVSTAAGRRRRRPRARARCRRRRRALAQDDRLVQGGPAQPVHVVDLDAGLDQPADDAGMPPLARADQSGPVEAVLARDVAAVGEGEVQQVEVALARRDEVRALLGLVLGVDVGAPGDEVAGRGDVVGPGGVAQAPVEVGLRQGVARAGRAGRAVRGRRCGVRGRLRRRGGGGGGGGGRRDRRGGSRGRTRGRQASRPGRWSPGRERPVGAGSRASGLQDG